MVELAALDFYLALWNQSVGFVVGGLELQENSVPLMKCKRVRIRAAENREGWLFPPLIQ